MQRLEYKSMKNVIAFLIIATTVCFAGTAKTHRVERYATYKAHTILPDALRFLVKRNGKHLFEGLDRGLAETRGRIDGNLILVETQKITEMINRQRPFKDVVRQMGYVAGLLSVLSDPSAGGDVGLKNGFRYYSDLKLPRFYFVFDGYEAYDGAPQRLLAELDKAGALASRNTRLLDRKYAEVGDNHRHAFDEQSAVFGVCSAYYSNLARLSAHLWYYAWSEARGDTTLTPFVKRQRQTRIAP